MECLEGKEWGDLSGDCRSMFHLKAGIGFVYEAKIGEAIFALELARERGLAAYSSYVVS